MSALARPIPFTQSRRRARQAAVCDLIAIALLAVFVLLHLALAWLGQIDVALLRIPVIVTLAGVYLVVLVALLLSVAGCAVLVLAEPLVLVTDALRGRRQFGLAAAERFAEAVLLWLFAIAAGIVALVGLAFLLTGIGTGFGA